MSTISAILASTPQHVVELAPADNPVTRLSLPVLMSSLSGETYQKFMVFEAVQLLIALLLSVVGVLALLEIIRTGRLSGPFRIPAIGWVIVQKDDILGQLPSATGAPPRSTVR